MDIAARKQAIQRSYTQKLGERERKVEEMNLRRASMLRNEAAAQSLHERAKPQEQDRSALDRSANEAPGSAVIENAMQVSSESQDGKTEGDLAVQTGGSLADRSVLDLSMEDSPTLGNFNRFPFNRPPNTRRPTHASSVSDFEPLSTITAGTSDSLDTFFGDEPQDDSVNNSRSDSRDDMLALSQIIDLARSRSPSPVHVRSNGLLDKGSDKDDKESIQIILGATPVDKGPDGTSFSEPSTDVHDPDDPNSRWSMTSHDSFGHSLDSSDALSAMQSDQALPKTGTPQLSLQTDAAPASQKTWLASGSGVSPNPPTTMDSDAYSTINRVLEHYHDSNAVSPQMVQDVRGLIRKGGWDPKKVTQLYLQQSMTNERTQGSNVPPEEADLTTDSVPREQRGAKLTIIPPAAAEKEIRDDLNEKIFEDPTRLRSGSIVSSNQLSPDDGDLKSPRASLNRPEDWAMSPFLGEYHQQALDSPIVEDERPTLPPKDIVSLNTALLTPPGHATSKPQLPEIGKLDLAINVESPRVAADPRVMHGGRISTAFSPAASQPTPSQAQVPRIPVSRTPPSPTQGSRPVMQTGNNAEDQKGARVAASAAYLPPQPPPIPKRAPDSADSQESIGDQLSGTTEATAKATSPTPEDKRLKKRYHIIKELVDTEHSFCQDMKVVDDIYKGTSNVIVVSPDDIKTLFGNSDQIVAFSTNFLDSLKQASKSVYLLSKAKRWRNNRISSSTTYSGTTDDQSSINGADLTEDEKDRKTFIGEAFKNHLATMEKVYFEYLKNHDLATSKLHTLQKSPKVQIWLKECRAYATDLTSAWDLDSLLVKPVQRLLKYPLLLMALQEVTPEDHPDWANIDTVIREVKCISQRINDAKKRAELFQAARDPTKRPRKESDVRKTFPKAFGRKTDKIRAQVGLADTVQDKEYAAIHAKFGTHFFQIQVVMRDVEMYTSDVQAFMRRFYELSVAMEAHVDVAQTSYPEVESRWRKFRMSMKDLSTTGLDDHVNAVKQHVVRPLAQLWDLHSGPQRNMDKRGKRLMDFARYKAVQERGDRPDKKLAENAEIFTAVNETLKEELPRLFALTGKLMAACLNNFVQIQIQWQRLLRRKLNQALEEAEVPSSAKAIVDSFSDDFAFFDNQVVSLSICNGSMINETPNLLSSATTLNGDDVASSRHGTSLDARRRTMSINSDRSPQLPQPDFGVRDNGGFFTGADANQLAPTLHGGDSGRRMRASSTLSGHSPYAPEPPPTAPAMYGRTYSYNNSTPVAATPGRLATGTNRHNTEPHSSNLRPSIDTPRAQRLSDDSSLTRNRYSGTTMQSNRQPRPGSPASATRHSGVFSSAMPMSDSPRSQSPVSTHAQPTDFHVVFLAASVYEFNIDRARKEAGYPYLTYAAGEVSPNSNSVFASGTAS